MPEHRLRYSARTHVGLRRKVNEDSILVLPEAQVWVVSDGMGGHEAGDWASQLVVDRIALIEDGLDPASKMYALRTALHQAHDAIAAEADRAADHHRRHGGGLRGRRRSLAGALGRRQPALPAARAARSRC